MGNSSISTLMGPTGPRGATAPDGSVGASGNTGSTGTTGNTGSTGAGISGSAGVTNCNQRLLKNKDGQYFVIGPIQGATGSPSGGVDGVVCDSCSAGFDCPLGSYCCCGHCIPVEDPCLPDLGSPCNPRVDINVLGGGASILRGVDGPTAYFKSIVTDDPDITIEELSTPAGLKISAPVGSGQQSQIVGQTGELLYYSGTTFISGATGTFYKESNGESAEANSLHVVLGDFKEVVKRHDPNVAEFVTLDLNEANTHYIVGTQGFRISSASTNTNAGYTALDSSEGVTYGESVNLTMIIKNGGLASDSQNPFATQNTPFKFYETPELSISGTDIINCISFNKGTDWHCFVAGIDYDVTYQNDFKIGACCTNGECRDYVFDVNCEGQLFDRVTCFSEPCSDDLGACCVNNSCFKFSRGKCDEIGGLFFINQQCGTFSCPDPCGELGCCCLGSAGKVNANSDICDDLGGIFIIGTLCDDSDDPCLKLTKGACCFEETCGEQLLPTVCSDAGGIHMGAGTICGNVDCCSGQTVLLGMCCTPSGCSPNYPVKQIDCSSSNSWNLGSNDCSICDTAISCNCETTTPTFKKWRLWIAGVTGTEGGNLQLLTDGIPTNYLLGPTGCDRMSDGYHNTHFDRYDEPGLIHDANTQAMAWAKSFNVGGVAVENWRYVPSISEMAYIVALNKQFDNVLIGDTSQNRQYWTSTRKEYNRFFTINESGWALAYPNNDNTQSKKSLAVYREMLADDSEEGNGYMIGDVENGAMYAGVFSTNCSLNLTNHNSETGYDAPTITCANLLEYGYCCIDDSTVCSINNEYDCIAASGVYSGDDLSADCVIESPCEDPKQPNIETVNCARAGVLSYKATEAGCAGGLAEQMYHYAGDIDTTTGLPVDQSTYSTDYIIGDGDFNINPVHVATDGELTQGYCLGHNKVTECLVDVNTLSPNVIAAGTLKAYCNRAKIYGTNYSCEDDSVCAGVSDYDRTIDDCFSTNTTGLCGKGLSTYFITLLNANDQSTCEQTEWPVDEYFPCGGSSCSRRIKVWPGTGASWPSTTSDDDFVSLFSCEPCLNSFCAFLMATNPDNANLWCRRAGDWTAAAALLYESYFEDVYYGECDENKVNDLNPFCGEVEVDWESLDITIQDFGRFSQSDVNNFKQSSVECLTRIEALSNGVVNCSGDIEGDYKDLLFANFREGVEHPNLLNSINDVPTKRTVPGALTTFTFVPVICPANGICIAGQNDLASTIGGTTPSRYTPLIYGIDSTDNTNISLVGSTNRNIGLCYADSCIDDMTPITGTRNERVEEIIRLNKNINNNNNKLYGMIVTNCQNRILCRDGQPCNVCGSLDDLQEEFDPPTVGCYNCANGECTTGLNCDQNEITISCCPGEGLCNVSNPCPIGQCCSGVDGEVCGDQLTFAQCNNIGGNWSQPDNPCAGDACVCEVDAPYGHCCTSTGRGIPTYSYTCENKCGNGAWQVAPTPDPNFCVPIGCCYQIINNSGIAEVNTAQTTQASCPLPNSNNPNIIFGQWSSNDPTCIPPEGSLCDEDGTCAIIPVIEAIISGGGSIPVLNPLWILNGSCVPNLCNQPEIFSCCQGDISDETLFCEDVPFGEEVSFCIPGGGKNTSGSEPLQNTQSNKPCESVNCETQSWGSCCFKSSPTDVPTCAYPTGKWHCLNTLNVDTTFTPTWSSGNDTDFCNLCGVETAMEQCCYYTTPRNQPQQVRCTMVEVGKCNRVTLTNQCGITNLDTGNHHDPFASPTDSTGDQCSVCVGAGTCCNCTMPDADVTALTCVRTGEDANCPTDNMSVRIILDNIVPLSGEDPASPVFCNPDIKVIICDMNSDESQPTDCPIPFEYGLYTDPEIPNTSYCCNDITAALGINIMNPRGLPGGIDLSRIAGIMDGSSYQFFVSLTNCHSQTVIPVGDGSFTYNSGFGCVGDTNPIGQDDCIGVE